MINPNLKPRVRKIEGIEIHFPATDELTPTEQLLSKYPDPKPLQELPAILWDEYILDYSAEIYNLGQYICQILECSTDLGNVFVSFFFFSILSLTRKRMII